MIDQFEGNGEPLYAPSYGLIGLNGKPLLSKTSSAPPLVTPPPSSATQEGGGEEVDETVQVRFKKQAVIQIEIDPDQLLWEDLQVIQRATSGTMTEDEAGEAFMDLLSKLTGQDARKLPIRVINSVVAQLKKMTGEDALKN